MHLSDGWLGEAVRSGRQRRTSGEIVSAVGYLRWSRGGKLRALWRVQDGVVPWVARRARREKLPQNLGTVQGELSPIQGPSPLPE